MLFFIDLSFMQKFREKILRMTLRISDFKKKKKPVDMDTNNRDWLRKYNKYRKINDSELAPFTSFFLTP